jgi:2-polyprenyl-3-methyl-5-hydroxy-6-metoxy-1,4-benzoquinol methylase
MECCQCQALEHLFDPREAQRELRQYRRRGPSKTTRLLVDAIKAQGIDGLTLLDIGGGIGAIQLGLLQAGASHATDVDASSAYLAAAREESEREGFAERATYLHGNFVEIAERVPPADIVTLERVVCCYPNMSGLVGSSLEKAQRFYGLVYPRDVWWTRPMAWFINFSARFILRTPFRFYIHPTLAVEAVVRQHGFEQRFRGAAGPWQVVLYGRTPADAGSA